MARPKAAPIKTVHMTPATVETIGLELWGEKWREEIAKFLGISYSQLHRYMTVYKGQTIPRVVATALILRRHFGDGTDMPDLDMHSAPLAEATPVKFVQVKKPKPERPDNDAPLIDLFGGTPEPAPTPEPEPDTTPTKPDRTGAGQGRKKTGQDKATKKPAAAKPAKKPATAVKPARRPAPRRKADAA